MRDEWLSVQLFCTLEINLPTEIHLKVFRITKALFLKPVCVHAKVQVKPSDFMHRDLSLLLLLAWKTNI